MKYPFLGLLALSLIGTPAFVTHALAQPDANQPPVAQNPPNQNAGGGRGGRGGQNGRGGFGNLSQAQRDQINAQNAQINELQTRQRLTYAGITDAKTQDALLAFLKEQETAQASLREKWNALLQSLRNQSTDAQIATALNNFRNALDDEKARRADALTKLDAQIGLSKNPKLDAQLTTSGLIGDEAAFINGAQGGGGRGNFGVLGQLFGGGFGGPGGGAGGFGGPGN